MGHRKNSYKSLPESDALTEAGPKPAPVCSRQSDQDSLKTAARQSSPLTGGPAWPKLPRLPNWALALLWASLAWALWVKYDGAISPGFVLSVWACGVRIGYMTRPAESTALGRPREGA